MTWSSAAQVYVIYGYDMRDISLILCEIVAKICNTTDKKEHVPVCGLQTEEIDAP